MEMKVVILVCLLFIAGSTFADDEFHCQTDDKLGFPREVCYIKKCTQKIQEHIKHELNAAFYYMLIAAKFDQDTVDRRGLANFLYESASEEREHALLMLDYLNSRGIPFEEKYVFGDNEMKKISKISNSTDYKLALETALDLEIEVTQAIYSIIEACEKDFHGADVFTDPILAEQHTGIRKLQGAIQTFSDLTKPYQHNTDELNLAEFIFDQKLLSGDI